MNILKKFRLLFGKSDVIVMDASTARCIADMQRDLDAYGFVFTNLIGYLNGRFGVDGRKAPAIGYGLGASKEVNDRIDMLYGSVTAIVKRNAECIESERRAKSDLDFLKRRFDNLSHAYDSMRNMVDISVDLGADDGDMSSYVIHDVFGNIVDSGLCSAEDMIEYYEGVFQKINGDGGSK